MKHQSEDSSNNVDLLQHVQKGHLKEFPRNFLVFVLVQYVPVLRCLFIWSEKLAVKFRFSRQSMFSISFKIF